MFAGDGRKSVGIRPVESPICHNTTKPRRAAAPASGTSRGTNAPPRNGTTSSITRCCMGTNLRLKENLIVSPLQFNGDLLGPAPVGVILTVHFPEQSGDHPP